MSGKEIIHQLVESPKVAAIVSAATTTTGAGTIFDIIPDDIGKLATLVGIILTIILIRVHLLSLEKTKMEVEKMRNDRIQAAIERKTKGEPVRRVSDT
jgi:hypothetical protein